MLLLIGLPTSTIIPLSPNDQTDEIITQTGFFDSTAHKPPGAPNCNRIIPHSLQGPRGPAGPDPCLAAGLVLAHLPLALCTSAALTFLQFPELAKFFLTLDT